MNFFELNPVALAVSETGPLNSGKGIGINNKSERKTNHSSNFFELFSKHDQSDQAFWGSLLDILMDALKKADKNGDGKLDPSEYKEFAKQLEKHINPEVKARTQIDALLILLQEIINADKNNDGVLDDEEVKSFLKDYLVRSGIDHGFSDEELDHIVNFILELFSEKDTNKDGQLSFEEFLISLAIFSQEDLTALLSLIQAINQTDNEKIRSPEEKLKQITNKTLGYKTVITFDDIFDNLNRTLDTNQIASKKLIPNLLNDTV